MSLHPAPLTAQAQAGPEVRLPLFTGAALIAAAAFGCLSLLYPAPTRQVILSWGGVLLGFGVAWVFLHRAGRLERDRWFHLLVGLSLGIHACWDLVKQLPPAWGAHLGTGSPGWRTLVQLVVPFLQLVAILSWRELKAPRLLRWREAMDAILFTLAVFLVFWLLGLGQLRASPSLPQGAKTLELIFFLDYALLMGVAFYRGLSAPGRFNGALGWLLAAFLVITLGNLAWIALTFQGAYYPGHPLELLAPFIHAFYLLAALARPTVEVERPGGTWRWSTGHLAAPYLPMLVALPLALRHLALHAGERAGVVTTLGLLMILIVMLRQVVALWDLRRSALGLERTIQERTGLLEELQAAVLRTQKLNLMATLGAGLAHDLKNLLSVVKLSSSQLEDELAEGRQLTVRDLGQIQTAADQAQVLVANLMAYGRLEAAAPERFDLNERLLAMAPLLERLATRSVQVTLALEPVFLPLEVDPTRVEQVLHNLVINARDAMPAGGRLRMLTRRQGDQAVLELADSGTGMAPETLAQIFQPFFTTKKPGLGTGLGLASVKAMVEACGGEIAVASEPGKGTTFTVCLPLARQRVF